MRFWAIPLGFIILGLLMRVGSVPTGSADPVAAEGKLHEVVERAELKKTTRVQGVITWLQANVRHFPLDARNIAIFNSIAYLTTAFGIWWIARLLGFSFAATLLVLAFNGLNGESVKAAQTLHSAIWQMAGMTLALAALLVELRRKVFWFVPAILFALGWLLGLDIRHVLETIPLAPRRIFILAAKGFIPGAVPQALRASDVAFLVPLWVVISRGLDGVRGYTRSVLFALLVVVSPGIEILHFCREVFKPERQVYVFPQSSSETLLLEGGELVKLELRPVAEGFTQPTGLYFLKHDEWIVTERGGSVWRVSFSGGKRELIAQVSVSLLHIEQGLIGFALHPNYFRNGLFYLHFTTLTEKGLRVRVEEWRVPDGQTAAHRTRVIMDVPFPVSEHWGGQLRFGVGERLYVGIGTYPSIPSGSSVIVALDINQNHPIEAITPNLVWAEGFRNPWSFSILPDQSLIVPDVGGDIADEINIVHFNEDFGFPIYEGTTCLRKNGCPPQPNPPALELRHKQYTCPIGGFIYHGRIAALRNHYLFSDFTSGKLFAARWPLRQSERPWYLGTAPINASMIAEGLDSELFLSSFMSGIIYKLFSAEL